ncbi:MAG: NAD(P)-dependent oxidoreductase [Gammaproteobacteria bacterium]|nr:NAD(P)-dependent oxidoreductase [Gammaproteobacteria bacterium]
MSQTIGFIGLGLMGSPMTYNLIKAGYDVHVYARRQVSLPPLLEAGAIPHRTPAELADVCDVVFICVTDDQSVEQIILGEKGLIHGAHADSVIIDMSTISPRATREIAHQLAKAHIHMLDAPISGGPQGAINGTLSIMVGGKPDIFQRASTLLNVLGNNVVHVGDHGAGQIAKACNQTIVAQTMSAIAEAFILARAAGVDPIRVRKALLGGFAGSRILEVHGQRMLDHHFAPGFKASLHRKDMNIVQQTAAELGIALPGTALSAQYLNALAHRDGEIDSSAICVLLEELSGVDISD